MILIFLLTSKRINSRFVYIFVIKKLIE